MKTNSISAGLAAHARTITTTQHLIFRRACLWTGFLAFATIAFGPQPAQAAVTEAWVHRYSNVLSNAADRAVKVVRDAAGDIIVTGTTAGGVPGQDMLTIKYSGADGSVLWQQRYNGPANSDDRASALAVDGSGNVVVTGSTQDENSWVDYYTAKYAAVNGALLWERLGPANSYSQANAVAVDGNGNVVVTGTSDGGYFTAKYAAADGALLWEQRYHGPANNEDFARAVAVDGSGNVVVTGNSYGTDSYDYYTAKYAGVNGALLWEQRYNGPANAYDFANALAVDGSGNVVVTGFSDAGSAWEAGFEGGDYYTAKYAAADGALLWEKRYNGPANGHDQANALAVDGSGNVVVTGFSDARFSNARSGSGGDYYTAKYAAADGALLWEQGYNGSAPNYASAQAVAVDGSGNIAVTGVAYNSNGPYDGDYYTAKYAAANGALLWEKRYNGPDNGEDFAKAVAVDGSGNVVVTGTSDSGTNGYHDYYTAKYAAADGTLLWEKRYNGPANWDDSASALAVDGSGNVLVTGGSSNGPDDYYTAKYTAADGALLWEKRYNGPANRNDFASALALDASGNVVVTGYSVGGVSGSDYYTAKYAAANGALLWEKRYNGPANSGDQAQAVAVDGSGNVVVTGYSGGGVSGLDYYTAKYAAADGALLWERRYNGPANAHDLAHALAVDGSGNVVVTGDSQNGPRDEDYDYYTVKYAAADGALLWERRYNGPANSSDFARAVAVDGSGNVVVTGNSSISGFDSFGYITYDYYTAKYAAVDGALLWEKRFSGPGSVGDSSQCLALGPDGMVAVTGTSKGGYATVVYREVPAVSIDLIPTGVRLRFTGVPGRSYNIERAPAVTGPWNTINTQTAPASGLFEYLDALPHPGSGFYRFVQP